MVEKITIQLDTETGKRRLEVTKGLNPKQIIQALCESIQHILNGIIIETKEQSKIIEAKIIPMPSKN